MPKQTNVAKSGGWAHFIVKWVIAAVAVILVAVGLVNLITTVYKGSLGTYPVESFRIDGVRLSAPDSKDTKAPELTEEQKKQQEQREKEQRVLAEINDYAKSVGQLLAGLGLMYVYLLIVKSERAHGRD